MNDRPLGLIDLDQLVQILPDLIADALRQRETRPAPDRRATLTKATGVVTTAGTTTAEVQLDEDEPGVLSQVQLASAVAAGDRVVVLMSPGGSAIAIGSGSAQTAVPLLIGPGDPNGVIVAPEGWLYEQNDAPALWQNTDGATAWQPVGSVGYWELTSDDLHLDPTTTAGLETLSLEFTDSGNNRYTLFANTTDFGLTNRIVGDSLAEITSNASADSGLATLHATVVSAGSDADGLISTTAGLDDANSEMLVGDGNGHTASVEVNADNANTPPTRFKVRANEGLYDLDNSAPPDAELAAGDFAFWLDSTNGAGKLMVKAKTADGTVVTGSVTLT